MPVQVWPRAFFMDGPRSPCRKPVGGDLSFGFRIIFLAAWPDWCLTALFSFPPHRAGFPSCRRFLAY